MSTAKPKSPPPYNLALKFLEQEKYLNKLHSWQGEFYLYENGFYKKVETGDFKAKVISFLQEGNSGIFKENITGKTLSDVILNLDSLCRIIDLNQIPTWLDSNHTNPNDFINLKNCIFNVKKYLMEDYGFLESHSSDFFTVNQCPFEFKENLFCPTWTKFLNEMIPDKSDQNLLQEWFGYNLIPDTSFQKFMILYGEGANGKSVVCSVLQALLGKNCISSVNLEAFDPKRTFLLAETVGKLANIVTDLNSFDKTAVGELKKFVSGDLMSAERKFKTPFFFNPTARLTFASNVIPHFSDSSDGIWRRLLLIKFNVQILDEKKQNRNLTNEDWWLSSGELPGVFNWALRGLRRLQANTQFTQSDTVVKEKEQLKRDSNPARTFLEDFCIETNIEGISSHYLYHEYREEMNRLGFKPMHVNKFSEEVRRTFTGVHLTPHVLKRPDYEMNEVGPQRSRLWIGIRKKMD